MLRKANVVEGALALLDTEGLDGLTMRKLGGALGVQAGALYRHFPSKEALLDAMAEQLLEGIADELPAGDWEQQLTALAERFRQALLTRRDGARLVAGTFVSAPNTNAAGAVAANRLVAAGLSPARAGWLTFACMYFVLGHTIEEQAQLELKGPDSWEARVRRSPPEDPVWAQALGAVVAADPGERFRYGLSLLLDGIRQQLPAET